MPRRLLKNRTINVIMMEYHRHLGEKYEVVAVKPIYARNVLLPKNIAVLANADMLHKYASKMKQATQDIAKKKELLSDFLNNIQSDGPLIIKAKVNENGVLYSKIHTEDIATAISTKYSKDVDVHCIKMKKIVAIGEYVVSYKYKELEKQLTVIVKSDEEEKKPANKKPNKPKAEDTKTEDTAGETKATEKKAK